MDVISVFVMIMLVGATRWLVGAVGRLGGGRAS
jgi:hypothetical protein